MANTPFLRSAGAFAGRRAADVVHGTRLGGTQFSRGFAEGYAARRDHLVALRDALLAEALTEAPAEVPVVIKQRRAAVKA